MTSDADEPILAPLDRSALDGRWRPRGPSPTVDRFADVRVRVGRGERARAAVARLEDRVRALHGARIELLEPFLLEIRTLVEQTWFPRTDEALESEAEEEEDPTEPESTTPREESAQSSDPTAAMALIEAAQNLEDLLEALAGWRGP